MNHLFKNIAYVESSISLYAFCNSTKSIANSNEADIKSPYWVFDIYYKRFWSFKIHFNSSDFITYNNVEANYLTVGISMYPNHL